MAQNISKNLSYIGSNIKKIRQAKNISQSAFAGLFNLARPSIGAYEEGRAEPKIETIIAISRHFNISIDVLLTKKMSSTDILNIGLLNKKLDHHHRKENEPETIQAPLIRIEETTNYIVNLEHKSYIDNLPKISTPSSFERIFQCTGNEMSLNNSGICHGDLIFCNRHEPMKNQVFVMITSASLMLRRVSDMSNESVVLSTDNPAYEELQLPINQIRESWIVKAIYTTQLAKPARLEQRLSQLEEKIKRLEST